VHQSVQNAVARFQVFEQLRDLIIEAQVAHEAIRARQIADQVLGFLCEAFVLVSDRQFPAVCVQLLRDGPGNASLVRQSKHYRGLLCFVHDALVS